MILSSKFPPLAAHSTLSAARASMTTGANTNRTSPSRSRTSASTEFLGSSRPILVDNYGERASQTRSLVASRKHRSRHARGGRGAITAAAADASNVSSDGDGWYYYSEPATSSGSVTTDAGDDTSSSANTASAAERESVTRAKRVRSLEDIIERSIFNFRFFTLMAVVGSLIGSALCFTKGCIFVAQSVKEFLLFCWHGVGTGKVILLLVEAVDVYLIGTVMLIFGIGLYELFVNSLDVPRDTSLLSPEARAELSQRICGSSLFGLFRLKARPKWLEIHSLDEMKTKLGHVIVMILLVGMFEKSKKVPVSSALDLLFFSASVCFAAGCLFLLSKLVGGGGGGHGGNGSGGGNGGRSHNGSN
ncbi:unnamed protein product [Closterium sp. NIES-65]|nr:unnamed protein product [Closterium sp. NIES-65]